MPEDLKPIEILLRTRPQHGGGFYTTKALCFELGLLRDIYGVGDTPMESLTGAIRSLEPYAREMGYEPVFREV
jgi:hypothetical protein